MILRSLESASKGMISLIDMHDNIANNLANVNTVGYKQAQLRFKDVYDARVVDNSGELIKGESATRELGTLSMGSETLTHTHYFAQGALQHTGNPFDLAIEGDGFFKIQSRDGSMAYTRNGSFTLDNNSFLITKEGDYVLDPEDQRISINYEDLNVNNIKEININEKGFIEINNANEKIQLQQIALYDFEDKEDLFFKGGSKIVPKTPTENPPLVAEKFTIQQGMLEMSNSNVIREMINTINTSRSYESLAKVVKNNSDMLKQAISLGRIRG